MTIDERWLAPAKRAANFLIVSLAIFLLMAICQAAAVPQTSPQESAAIERGRKQFGETCGFCHGPDATGARGPDLVRSPIVAHDVKGELIGDVIRHGRPDKGMPAMPLTDQQVSDIAAYLHARAAEALNSSDVPSTYPVEKLLTGDAEAGKTYFLGAGGCKNCHSATGDLSGIARKYSPIDLEARMLYPEGEHRTAIVTLHSGEKIEGEVAHIDEFEIALRDDSGWYRSFSRDRVKIELQDPLAAHRELLPRLTQEDVHNLFAYLESLK
ncbi:MAG: cytochrome c [Candidatus Acidiferrum sp.]